MKKIISIGLLAGLVMFAVWEVFGFVFNLFIPGVKQEYVNNPVFRPWSDPLMSLIFVHPFVLGIILAWFWTKLKVVLEPAGKMGWLYFAFAYFLITIPGMFISYSTFPVSILMIFNWTLSGLIEVLCASLIYAKFLK